VVLNPANDTFRSWGSAGSGEGQFNETTGLTIAQNLVYAADSGNNRIQVFQLNGEFVKQWEVQPWERFATHFPDIVFDDVKNVLYVSNGRTSEILAFDLNGNPLPGFKPDGNAIPVLGNPSAMTLLESGKSRWLLVVNTRTHNVAKIELDSKPT
jgi:DNA-binding beta-propeller fold protein YncE